MYVRTSIAAYCSVSQGSSLHCAVLLSWFYLIPGKAMYVPYDGMGCDAMGNQGPSIHPSIAYSITDKVKGTRGIMPPTTCFVFVRRPL